MTWQTEYFNERAAMYEYEAGYDREEAELRAREDVEAIQRRVNGDKQGELL